MYRVLTFLFFTTLILFARYDAVALQECAAYNNLKHTHNTHGVHLQKGHSYTVLNDHKGQKLILVKGEQPAQRWVERTCLASKSRLDVAEAVTPVASVTQPRESEEKLSNDNLLALSWHNAFCETHRYKKECKRNLLDLLGTRQSDDRFVLHGLWPQPRSKVYCDVPRNLILLDKHKQWHKLPPLKLSSETRTKLKELMPGYSSYLHRHEWIKHGTCYGTDPEHYFSDALHLTEQVNDSNIRAFFVKNRGKIVDLTRIRLLFDKAFGRGAGRKVALVCKQGMITELWLHIGGGSDDLATLLREGKAARSRCKRGRIDKAGFGKKGGFGR